MANLHLGAIDDDEQSSKSVRNKVVYLTIRRKTVTLFFDVKEDTRVLRLKKMIEGLLKVQPEDQQLFIIFMDNHDLEEYKELSDSTACLSDYELTPMTATVTQPATLGLAVRQKDGTFESLEMTPYSNLLWPDLSDQKENEDVETCTAIHEKYEKMLNSLNEEKIKLNK